MLKDERSRGGAGRSEKEVVREDENKEGEDQEEEEKKLEDDQEKGEYKYEAEHFLIVMTEKLVIKMCRQTLLPTTWHYLFGVVVCR